MGLAKIESTLEYAHTTSISDHVINGSYLAKEFQLIDYKEGMFSDHFWTSWLSKKQATLLSPYRITEDDQN